MIHKILSALILFVAISFCYAQQTQKATATKTDACTVLSQQEVEDLLKEKVNKPTPVGTAAREATARDAAISSCAFQMAGASGGQPPKSMSLWIRRSPVGYNDANTALDAFLKDPRSGAAREMTALEDLGDAAYWKSEKLGNQPRVEVDARKNDVVVQVILTGHNDALAAQSTARSVIEKVFEKMGVATR